MELAVFEPSTIIYCILAFFCMLLSLIFHIPVTVVLKAVLFFIGLLFLFGF